MNLYTAQPIAVHPVMERQNFRRGNCGRYANVVLYDAPNFQMPNILIKRAKTGASATVTLCDLDDQDVDTLTPTSATNYDLDTEDEFEMLVLGTGNWAGSMSLQTGAYYYLRIEAGSFTYYTDEFVIEADTDGFPPDCEGRNYLKITWFVNGACIYGGTTAANPSEPVLAYPDTSLAFKLFWRADVSRPEWQSDISESADAHGQPVVSRRSLYKEWKAEGDPVSETVADALHTVFMSDLIALEYRSGIAYSGITRAECEQSWQNGGCLASVELKFRDGYMVKQGCC